MISIFHGNDEITHEKFQRWRKTNIDGFHMTEGPARKFTIHYAQDKRENSTGRGCMHQGVSDIAYIEDKDSCYTRARKVCSNSLAELLAWAKKQGFTTKNCKHCDTKRFPFPKYVSLPDIKELQAEQAKPSRATAGGAGFGNPEDNKEVETVAIAFVTNMYESKGWRVKSVENEKCGFDLICTNGETIENVEVKGISGDGLNFIITTGELEEAKKNNEFVLYAVTQALSVPHSNKFSGAELSEMFNMVPLQYRAVYKK
jgi:hypothetical protein